MTASLVPISCLSAYIVSLLWARIATGLLKGAGHAVVRTPYSRAHRIGLNMKSRLTQFGARENTASSRQHAPRPSASQSLYEPRVNLLCTPRDKISVQGMPSSGELFRSSLSKAGKRATGEERSDTYNPTIAGREHES